MKAEEQKKVAVSLVTAATSISLILSPLIYAMVFSPLNSPLDFWKPQVLNWGSDGGGAGAGSGRSSGSIKDGRAEEDEPLTSMLGRLLRGKDRTELETTGFACKSDNLNNDVCVAKQQVWMKTDEAGALTVYLSSSSNQNQTMQQPPLLQQIRPYVKKNDDHARKWVKQIKIQTLMQQSCNVSHDVPAVIFSTGLIGNAFHELNEIIIPLFLTTRHFHSRFQFVVTDFNPKWIQKYARILSHLSNYELIDASKDKRVHCFPGAVIGLHFHNDNLVCSKSDLPVNCSISDFREFLREALDLKFKNVVELIQDRKQKPLLVLLSRRHSRRFLNKDDMVRVATELGFEVMVAQPELTSNLDEFSGVVNRCSVLVGTHGAGLTNEVFLPEGAVMVQIVPWGLQWASANYYGIPLGEMGVKYLEYQINPQESTLLDVYGPDHPVITDPGSIYRLGYKVSRPIYVDGQDVRVNITRFKETLVQALGFLGR